MRFACCFFRRLLCATLYSTTRLTDCTLLRYHTYTVSIYTLYLFLFFSILCLFFRQWATLAALTALVLTPYWLSLVSCAPVSPSVSLSACLAATAARSIAIIRWSTLEQCTCNFFLNRNRTEKFRRRFFRFSRESLITNKFTNFSKQEKSSFSFFEFFRNFFLLLKSVQVSVSIFIVTFSGFSGNYMPKLSFVDEKPKFSRFGLQGSSVYTDCACIRAVPLAAMALRSSKSMLFRIYGAADWLSRVPC